MQYRETCRSLLEDTRRKHPEESQRGEHRETCRGTVDYRIQGKLRSTVKEEGTNRKETVKRLIQRVENHPNRDSLIKDLNETEEFNPFSEESKELIGHDLADPGRARLGPKKNRTEILADFGHKLGH